MAQHDPAQRLPWHAQMRDALGRHMLLKAVATPLFIAVFFAAYFYLLKYPAYPTTIMPTIWLDRVIPFVPDALFLYVSLWVYVSLPPALLVTRPGLFRYAFAIAATCLVGLLIFYIWPTAVPVADIDWSRYPEVHALKNIDAAGNAFPSLHVATAVFSGLWLHCLLRRFAAPNWLLAINALWGAGIVYSTLATRQHVAVDVLGGLLLGGVAGLLSLRTCRQQQGPL